jgi:RNA polymerase sigma factor (sigma-70 family)
MADLPQRQFQEEEYVQNDDATLFDRYGQAVLSYACLHTSSREDAEDITLEVFMAALEHDNLTALADGERLAWLRRVAHNKIVDSYRKWIRHPTVGLNTVAEMIYEDGIYTPEHIVIKQELLEQLAIAISTLSPLQQQVLRLRFGHELPFAEIAVLLQRREDAVRKLLSRTVALLRNICRQ